MKMFFAPEGHETDVYGTEIDSSEKLCRFLKLELKGAVTITGFDIASREDGAELDGYIKEIYLKSEGDPGMRSMLERKFMKQTMRPGSKKETI